MVLIQQMSGLMDFFCWHQPWILPGACNSEIRCSFACGQSVLQIKAVIYAAVLVAQLSLGKLGEQCGQQTGTVRKAQLGAWVFF